MRLWFRAGSGWQTVVCPLRHLQPRVGEHEHADGFKAEVDVLSDFREVLVAALTEDALEVGLHLVHAEIWGNVRGVGWKGGVWV